MGISKYSDDRKKIGKLCNFIIFFFAKKKSVLDSLTNYMSFWYENISSKIKLAPFYTAFIFRFRQR